MNHLTKKKESRKANDTGALNRPRPRVKPATMTLLEAARYLGISKTKALYDVQSGELPGFKLGGRWIIPIAALHNKFPILENSDPWDWDPEAAS